MECLLNLLKERERALRALSLVVAGSGMALTGALVAQYLSLDMVGGAIAGLATLILFTLPLLANAAFVLAGREKGLWKGFRVGLKAMVAIILSYIVVQIAVALLTLLVPPLHAILQPLAYLILYAYSNMAIAKALEGGWRSFLDMRGLKVGLLLAALAMVFLTIQPISPLVVVLSILGEGILRLGILACALPRSAHG